MSEPRRSRHFQHMVALRPQHPEETPMLRFRADNPIGSTDDLAERLRAHHGAGVDHVGLVFLGNAVDGLLDGTAVFAKHGRPRSAGTGQG